MHNDSPRLRGGIAIVSSDILKDIICKLPMDRVTIERIGKEVLSGPGDKAFTIDRLYDLVTASSKASLSRVLHELVAHGILESFVTVESDTGGGIDEFETVSDVPDIIYDPYTGKSFEVTPNDIRVWFCRARTDP